MPRRPQNIGEVIFNALSAGVTSFPGFQQQQLQNKRQAETDSLNEIMAGLDAEFQKEQNRQFALKGEALDGEVAEKVRLSKLSEPERAAEKARAGVAGTDAAIGQAAFNLQDPNFIGPFDLSNQQDNIDLVRSTLQPNESRVLGNLTIRGETPTKPIPFNSDREIFNLLGAEGFVDFKGKTGDFARAVPEAKFNSDEEVFNIIGPDAFVDFKSGKGDFEKKTKDKRSDGQIIIDGLIASGIKNGLSPEDAKTEADILFAKVKLASKPVNPLTPSQISTNVEVLGSAQANLVWQDVPAKVKREFGIGDINTKEDLDKVIRNLETGGESFLNKIFGGEGDPLLQTDGDNPRIVIDKLKAISANIAKAKTISLKDSGQLTPEDEKFIVENQEFFVQ